MDADATALNLMIDISANIADFKSEFNSAIEDITDQVAEVSKKLGKELDTAFGIIDTKINAVTTSMTGVTDMLRLFTVDTKSFENIEASLTNITNMVKSFTIDTKSFENIEAAFESILVYAGRFAKELKDESTPLSKMLKLFTSIKDVILAKNKALLLEAKYLKAEPDTLKDITEEFNNIAKQVEEINDEIGGAGGWVDWTDKVKDNIDRITAALREMNTVLDISSKSREKFNIIGYRQYGSVQDIQQQIIALAADYKVLGEEAEAAYKLMMDVGVPTEKIYGYAGAVAQFATITGTSTESLRLYVRQAAQMNKSAADVSSAFTELSRAAYAGKLTGEDLNKIMNDTIATQAELSMVFGKKIDFSQWVKIRAELAATAKEALLPADAFSKLIDQIAVGGQQSEIFQAFMSAGIDIQNVKNAKDMAKALDDLSTYYNLAGGGNEAIMIQKALEQAMGITHEQANALFMANGQLSKTYDTMAAKMKIVKGTLDDINDAHNWTFWRQSEILLANFMIGVKSLGLFLDKTFTPILYGINVILRKGIEGWKGVIEQVNALASSPVGVWFAGVAAEISGVISELVKMAPWLQDISDGLLTFVGMLIIVVAPLGVIIYTINKLGGAIGLFTGKLNTAGTAATKTGGLFTRAIKSIGDIISSVADVIVKVAGKMYQSIAEGISKIAAAAQKNIGGILALTAGLLGIAGAVWIVSHAMKTLSTIDNLWEVFGAFAAIVAVLTVSLITLTFVASAALPALIPLAGVMLALSASVLILSGAFYVTAQAIHVIVQAASILADIMIKLFNAIGGYSQGTLLFLAFEISTLSAAAVVAVPAFLAFSMASLVMSAAIGVLGVAAYYAAPQLETVRKAIVGLSEIRVDNIYSLSSVIMMLAGSIAALGIASFASFLPIMAMAGLIGLFTLGALLATPIIDALAMAFGRLAASIERLASFTSFFGAFKKGGAKLIDTVAEGVESKSGVVVGAVSKEFARVGRLLPHSNAEIGPFSDLTGSGSAIISTMAGGLADNEALTEAMTDKFDKVSNMELKMPEILTSNANLSKFMDQITDTFGDNDRKAVNAKSNPIPVAPVMQEDRRKEAISLEAIALNSLVKMTATQASVINTIYSFLVSANPVHLNKLDELIKALRDGSGSNSTGEFGNNTTLNNWV